MDTPDILMRLGLALAIGFLIGLERGWRNRGEKEGNRTAGIRTFSLLGLMGGAAGAMIPAAGVLPFVATLIVTGLVLGAFMWREGERQNDLSVTGFVAAILTLLLGAMAVTGPPAAAASCGVVAAIMLAHKEILHDWLTRVTWLELRSGLVLAAMTFVALPLLPDHAIDPWQMIEPRALWLMTVLIAAVSFAGYVLSKLAGPRRGLLLSALTGGLFASTAVTVSLARIAKGNPGHVRMLAGCATAANGVMLGRVLLITALLNAPLAGQLAAPLLMAMACFAIIAPVLLGLGRHGQKAEGAELVLHNPFDLAQVLRFGAALAFVSVATLVAARHFGASGVLAVAALSGFADVDAVTLSVARNAQLADVAGHAILVAVAVNSFAKCLYASVIGGAKLGALTALAPIAAVTAAAVAVL